MREDTEFLWYIPNQAEAGHRGDTPVAGHNSLDTLAAQALAVERHGWRGALLGSGWGRPDTLTVAAALVGRTTCFEPLIAIRPGYWQPAQFACAGATLDQLSGGRVRVNIVSGIDKLAAYGDAEGEQAQRYARTKEFMVLLRRLWTQERVDFSGDYFQLRDSTVLPRLTPRPGRAHPKLYFGGASPAAERVAATEADVQLFWGEPLADLAARIDRLRRLSRTLDRDLPPLSFGLRITAVVRETSAAAWAAAEQKLQGLINSQAANWHDHKEAVANGQQRLLDLQARGEVLDGNLFTAPAKYGAGGAASTWLVGSAAEVAAALRRYQALGISQFILSDTPYLTEIQRQGETLLPLLRHEMAL